MRQKFGNVALYMIEVSKENEKVFDTHDYRNVKEFAEFKRVHSVSDKMMSLAYEYSKLYLQGAIKTPYEFIDKVSMSEANREVVKIKGDRMAKQDFNTDELNVEYEDGKMLISGTIVKDSDKIRTFLKQHGGNYNPENEVWIVDDFLANAKDKSVLDKRAMANGLLKIIHQNEQLFDKAKDLFYKAKSTGDEKLIESRELIYNVANIVLNDNFSKQDRKKYLDEVLDKSLKKIEELEEVKESLETNTSRSPKQEEFLQKITKQLDGLYKNVENHGTKLKHLDALERDVNKLKELGYMKEVTTKSGKNITVVASKEHKSALAFLVKLQNDYNNPEKQWIDNFLVSKASEINDRKQQENQEQRESEDNRQEAKETQNEEPRQTPKRNYR